METRSEMIKTYLLCAALTMAVFGLGYFCGQQAEQHGPAFGTPAEVMKTTGTTTRRASARPDRIHQQRNQHKSALLV